MRPHLLLLRVVAAAAAKFAVRSAGNFVGFGMAGDLVVEIWEAWGKQSEEKQRREAVETLGQEGAQVVKEMPEIAKAAAVGQSPEVAAFAENYLKQMPALVRRTLRRPTDPTGRTLPPGLILRKAADLLPFLPDRLALFQKGDRPLKGVDWELDDLLGVGGFGEVWKARHPQFSAIPAVALKFCDPQMANALQHEADIINRVLRHGRHPGIVELRQAYIRASPPCLEYEFIEGGDLGGLILEMHRKSEPPAPLEAARLVLEAAEAVAFVHREQPPIVHRDLKPANILTQRTAKGRLRLKVADFGIGGLSAGRLIRSASTNQAATLYQASLARGTHSPLYASPQQKRGDAPDPRDDVHALGVIWHQMLTGDLAQGAPTGLDWANDLQARGMAQDQVQLLASCFSSRPDRRPADAGVLRDELRRLFPALPPPSSQSRPLAPPAAPPARPPAAAPPKPPSEVVVLAVGSLAPLVLALALTAVWRLGLNRRWAFAAAAAVMLGMGATAAVVAPKRSKLILSVLLLFSAAVGASAAACLGSWLLWDSTATLLAAAAAVVATFAVFFSLRTICN